MSHVDDLEAVEDSADFFLAKTIRSMEEKMNDTHENVQDDTGDYVGSGEDCVICQKVNSRFVHQWEIRNNLCKYLLKTCMFICLFAKPNRFS